MSKEEQAVECSVCGRNGQPPASCETCGGRASVVSRAYTLSEVRAGIAPSEDRHGNLEPKSSPLVVGGAVTHPSHPQKEA